MIKASYYLVGFAECGVPSCHGFSGMNRFNSSQYSFFKVCNTLHFHRSVSSDQ